MTTADAGASVGSSDCGAVDRACGQAIDREHARELSLVTWAVGFLVVVVIAYVLQLVRRQGPARSPPP